MDIQKLKYYQEHPNEALRHVLLYNSDSKVWVGNEETYYRIKLSAMSQVDAILTQQWKASRIRYNALFAAAGVAAWVLLDSPGVFSVGNGPRWLWAVCGALSAVIGRTMSQQEIRRTAKDILKACNCYPSGLTHGAVQDSDLAGNLQVIFANASKPTQPRDGFFTIDSVIEQASKSAALMTFIAWCVLLLLL